MCTQTDRRTRSQCCWNDMRWSLCLEIHEISYQSWNRNAKTKRSTSSHRNTCSRTITIAIYISCRQQKPKMGASIATKGKWPTVFQRRRRFVSRKRIACCGRKDYVYTHLSTPNERNVYNYTQRCVSWLSLLTVQQPLQWQDLVGIRVHRRKEPGSRWERSCQDSLEFCAAAPLQVPGTFLHLHCTIESSPAAELLCWLFYSFTKQIGPRYSHVVPCTFGTSLVLLLFFSCSLHLLVSGGHRPLHREKAKTSTWQIHKSLLHLPHRTTQHTAQHHSRTYQHEWPH